MPGTDQILAGLTKIANHAFGLAIAWHVAVAAAVLALALGWRPSRRLAGALLSAPAISVAALAFAYGNPFNGTVFAALAATLALTASRLGTDRVRAGTRWSVAAGAALVAVGWLYPHFLIERASVAYLYAAPTGLVPCSTLSLMIGWTVIAGGLQSRAWSLMLATAGLFYGVFGAARLGVTIDVVLVAGALLLVPVALLPHQRRARRALARER